MFEDLNFLRKFKIRFRKYRDKIRNSIRIQIKIQCHVCLAACARTVFYGPLVSYRLALRFCAFDIVIAESNMFFIKWSPSH